MCTLSENEVDSAFAAIGTRTARSLADVDGEFPLWADPETGVWTTTPEGNWCAGHWIALLRLAAHHSEDEETGDKLSVAADEYESSLPAAKLRGSMFAGVAYHLAGFRSFDLTGDRRQFGLGLRGADEMLALFDERARQVVVGDLATTGLKDRLNLEIEDGARIAAVDALATSVPVLWRAWEETRRPRFRDTALAHTDRHLDWFIDEEGRTCHKAAFDPESGGLVRRYNELAASDETCWSRGQAWSIAGLAVAYARTRARRHLDSLDSVTTYYRRHTPGDGVPSWDFEAADGTDEPRDSSAAAITADGLLALPSDPEVPAAHRTAVSRLREYGHELLASLVGSYLVTNESDPLYGGVRHGCYNKPSQYATDAELLWGDYYLTHALHRIAS